MPTSGPVYRRTVQMTLRASYTNHYRWKAHPVVLSSRVLEAEPGRALRFDARARGLRADHRFTLHVEGTGTRVRSTEVQFGLLPWFGRAVLGPSLFRETETWLTHLAESLDNSSNTVLPVPDAERGRHRYLSGHADQA